MSVWTSLFAAPPLSRPLDQAQFEALIFDLLHQRLVETPCAVLAGAVDVQCPLGIANLFDGVKYTPMVNGVPQVERSVSYEAYKAGARLPHSYQVDHFIKEYEAGAVLPYEDKGPLTFYYQGKDEAMLRQALKDFPYGQENLCVWFAGLDYTNPLFADTLAISTPSPDVLLYALAYPQTVTVTCCGAQWVPAGELQSLEGVELEGNWIEAEKRWEDGIWDDRINEYQVRCCFQTAAMKGGPYEIVGTPLEPLLTQHFGPDLFLDCAYS